MNKEDFKWWSEFREIQNWYLTDAEYRMISEIHARVFNHDLNYPCKCNPEVIKLYILELNEKFTDLC
jgi:hypothetical protein